MIALLMICCSCPVAASTPVYYDTRESIRARRLRPLAWCGRVRRSISWRRSHHLLRHQPPHARTSSPQRRRWLQTHTLGSLHVLLRVGERRSARARLLLACTSCTHPHPANVVQSAGRALQRSAPSRNSNARALDAALRPYAPPSARYGHGCVAWKRRTDARLSHAAGW